MHNKMYAAIVGCGHISNIYLQNLTTRFPNLEVVACCDVAVERAQERASQYGIEARTYEDVLANVKKYTRNGSIITFHDSLRAEKNLKHALPLAIEWLLEQGYSFKTFE